MEIESEAVPDVLRQGRSKENFIATNASSTGNNYVPETGTSAIEASEASPTSFMVNSRTLMGCADTPIIVLLVR